MKSAFSNTPKTVTTTGASGMLNQPNFLAKLTPSKTLLNPQPRPKGDIKSTLEAARQRRLAMEQRNSKEVEQETKALQAGNLLLVE